MRRSQRHLIATAVAGTLLAALTSCADPETTPSPTPAISTPTTPVSTTPTPTPRPPSPSKTADQLAAEQAVIDFWKVLDHLATEPDSDLNELHTVARGQAFDQWLRNILQFRYDKVRQVGSAVVEDPTAEPTTKRQIYSVRTCLDVSDIDVVDRHGKSMVNQDAPDRISYVYKVQVDGRRGYVINEKAGDTC